MDKLKIKRGSFIQQTQYFIPVEIDLSVVPARLGIWFFHLSDVSFHWYRTNVNVEACPSDTGSHNRLDLINDLVQTHYVWNKFI